MQEYTLYWLNGEREVVKGDTFRDAFLSEGYGAGTRAALDFWSDGNVDDYVYNKSKGVWVKKTQGTENKLYVYLPKILGVPSFSIMAVSEEEAQTAVINLVNMPQKQKSVYASFKKWDRDDYDLKIVGPREVIVG